MHPSDEIWERFGDMPLRCRQENSDVSSVNDVDLTVSLLCVDIYICIIYIIYYTTCLKIVVIIKGMLEQG